MLVSAHCLLHVMLGHCYSATLPPDDSTPFVALFVEWFGSDSAEVQLALRYVRVHVW